MTLAYELAELIRSCARDVCSAENLCDAMTLRVESLAPLTASLPGGVRLSGEHLRVCAGVRDRLFCGACVLALQSAGGQVYYIVDILSEEEL